MRIVHVIERLGRGGASRSMLAQAAHAGRGAGREHTVVSLLAPEAGGVRLAQAAGVRVVHGDALEERRQIEQADVVQVHFWNSPDLYAWLRRDLPATRLLLTCHVAGAHPAQVLTPALIDFADFTALTTPYSLGLEVIRALPAGVREAKVDVVLDAADFGRLRQLRAGPRPGFAVGYVGTVGFGKLHPRFVPMCLRARLPEARFLVAGSGDAFPALAREAKASGAADRFELLGYVDDVASVLERLHVFGYPLRADNYATGELVLQEAMFAGIAPVILAHGAPTFVVEDRVTGLVARDEAEYAEALERLAADPGERARLGARASEFARSHLGVANTTAHLSSVYERLLAMPRQSRSWKTLRLSPHHGADAFVESLGETAPQFRRSLLPASEEEAREAERLIAAASPVVVDGSAGGVLHYRRFYPRDAYLRLWSGLVLLAQGRPALAAAEFQGAIASGVQGPRLKEYLARALERTR